MNARAIGFTLPLLAGVVACDDDELTPIDFGPTGSPHIAFAEPASAAGEPVCVEVTTETDFRVPLLIETDEVVLRPPGTCGLYAQCGHLQLFANDVLNNEGAVRAIDLLMRKLADRYHDGSVHAGSGEPDLLRLRIQLVNVNGEPLLDHEGEPLADELELITVPSCDDAER